jgi:hypothetical protein
VNCQPSTLDRSKAARQERKAAIGADRVRGLTMRRIAQLHRVSLGLVHQLTHDVHVLLPNAWHRARLPKEVMLPLEFPHRYRSPEL